MALLGHREAIQREEDEARLKEIQAWCEFDKDQKVEFSWNRGRERNESCRILSFAMALHHRLGNFSAAKVLDDKTIMLM